MFPGWSDRLQLWRDRFWRHGRAAATSLVVCGMAVGAPGCIPPPRAPATDSGATPDTAKQPDAASGTDALDAIATQDADASGQAGADTAVEPDQTAEDAAPLPQGCATDTDCTLAAPPCQKAACDLAKGLCLTAPLDDGAACPGDACQEQASCIAGVCSGTSKNCDDANACTTDTCHPLLGCRHAATTGACTDGDSCTASDNCVDGACKSVPQICVDADPCTVDSCNPASGQCIHKPVDNAAKTPCSSGSVNCGGPGVCVGGQCQAGAGTDPCNDGNACTLDVCPGPGYGQKDCLHLTMFGAACKVGCDPGQCIVGDGGPTCQPGPSTVSTNPCVVPKCDPAIGQWSYLEHKPDGTPCTGASNPCVTNTSCLGGLCSVTTGIKLTCNDSNPCTADTCSPTGCTYTPNDGPPCNDGSVCTTGDACSNGACVGAAANCEDGNPCTTDVCSPLSGCSHNPAADGGACGSGKTCLNGTCVGPP